MVIVSSLDDWIARQSTLVTKKRRVLDVVAQRMQIAEGPARISILACSRGILLPAAHRHGDGRAASTDAW